MNKLTEASSIISARRTSSLLCTLLISVVFLISFRTFAPFLAPKLNSDNAIHILMAYHLKLPDDLYYWGQDRLGSVVPILSHFLLQLVPIPTVEAVSYVQYSLLLLGFLAFSSLFRNWVSRLVFACVWFLPLQPFTELIVIGQPYGAQLAFIGISLFLFDRVSKTALQFITRQLLISLATASLLISLWVSDFTIVTVVTLAAIGLKYLYKQFFDRAESTLKLTSIAVDVVNVTSTSLLGFLFIAYAKEQAARSKVNETFNSIEQVLEVLGKLSNSFLRTLTFRANNIFLSIHAILGVILFVYFAYLVLIAKRQNSSRSRWLYLLIANAIVGFVLLVLSNWVYTNGINLRYFTFVYLMVWLSALLFAETLQESNAKRAYILLIAIALSSSLSLPSYVLSLEKPEAKIQSLQELQSLGAVGLIGEYWSSYVLCSVNPALLDCTPRDPKGKTPCPSLPALKKQAGRVRCSRCVPQVLAAKTIYLVKERWFDTFPEQIQQFRQCLIKVGEPRELAGYTLAPYQKRSNR
jgi:hypothetical protein